MNAFLLHAIHTQGKMINPGSIIELDDNEFDRLEQIAIVRSPTKNEITLFLAGSSADTKKTADKGVRRKAGTEDL